MTLDELARALFPPGRALTTDDHGVVSGRATTRAGREVGVVGIAEGKPVGIEAALALSGHVLDHLGRGGRVPLAVLVDTRSQAMARRDELLGLNDYLAQLTLSLVLASLVGHRTVGILYGQAAAGAFIATALATDTLIAVPGADPSVMDLPSIARITKLPLERLRAMSASTPIFAPGLDHLAKTGAVAEIWDDPAAFADQLDAVLAREAAPDERDERGVERQGRLKAAAIARRVAAEGQGSALDPLGPRPQTPSLKKWV